MAFDLKKLTKGKQRKPWRVAIHGLDGAGKTRWAAGAPDPFFIDANRGSAEYDVRRYVPDTWAETKEVVLAVERGDIKCKTLVLDAMGDFESMAHKEIFPGSDVGSWQGGWGKGDDHALMHWREFLSLLERVWTRGIWVILVAHTTARAYDDPTTGARYDRWELAVRPKLAGLLRQWSDAVVFAKEEVTHQKVGENTIGVSTGLRSLYTSRAAAYDAKSRGVIPLPEKLVLSWDAFQRSIEETEERATAMRSEVDRMLAEIGDTGLSGKVLEYLRSSPDELAATHNRVSELLSEKRRKMVSPDQPASQGGS